MNLPSIRVDVDTLQGTTPEDYLGVLPIFDGDDADALSNEFGLHTDLLRRALRRRNADLKRYDSLMLVSQDTGPDVLLVGAGGRDDLTPVVVQRIAAVAARQALDRGFSDFAIVDRFALSPAMFGRAAVEGAIDGPLSPGIKKTRAGDLKSIENVLLLTDLEKPAVEGAARVGALVAQGRAVARTLVNMPPNDLTPQRFAELSSELAGEFGLRCEILDEARLEQLGAGAILGVAAGSDKPPRIIRLQIGNPDASVRLAAVGKGLTFDSGGLSIKTAQGMETMKSDMGGGAAVVGGLVALSRLGLTDILITGYVGATENMSGPAAMRPGDVLTAMSGETIEVLNTDAEGRLVLADVLHLAVSEGATHIVDFATLTGGAQVALGSAATLAVGKPDGWVQEVVAAAEAGLERAWQMPLYEEYRRAMDSDVADIKNTGGRLASALTAAAFLSDFVGQVPWAHLDIAGTAFAESSAPWRSSGGTGVGVGTLVAVATALAGNPGSFG